MQAVIMAGGKGTRLKPLTCNIPKPMVPIMNKPILEHILFLLKRHNINNIGMTLMHIPQTIEDYFGDGSSLGVNISYYTEDFPLGTAGSIKNATSKIKNTFLVVSGDCLTDINITKAIEYHKLKKSQMTLCLTRVKHPESFGVVSTNNNGEIIKYSEKPNPKEIVSDIVNAGIYIIEPELLKYIPDRKSFDFSIDLFPLLLKNKVKMYGYYSHDYWVDVGTNKEYINTHINLFFNHRIFKNNKNIGNNTIIEQGAIIKSPCLIGNNCYIEKGAIIEQYTVLGDNCHIKKNSSIKKSILWNNVIVESDCIINDSVICDNVILKRCVFTSDNAIVSSNTIIKEGTVLKSNNKPFIQVSKNIV